VTTLARMRALRFLLVSTVLLAIPVTAWMLHKGYVEVPARFNPWAPLDIAEKPGVFTRMKLQRLGELPPAACYAWLDTAGVRHTPIADRHETESCGWHGATRLSALGGVRLSSPAPLACPEVAALALWERHALQPAALVHLGSRVSRIDHLGSYACRNIYGGSYDRRSEHARANALDVAAFRMADGRTVSVLKGWRKGDVVPMPLEALFLREASRGACPFFSAVLGPEYNAAHRDHLHLDLGVYRVCS